MKRIYIVTCGEYEDKYNEFVTNDIDKAVEFALSRYNCSNYFEKLNTIEVWENGVKICNYGMFMIHKISEHKNLTFLELKKDLEKYIK